MSKNTTKEYIPSDSLPQIIIAKFKNKRGKENQYMRIPKSATIIK